MSVKNLSLEHSIKAIEEGVKERDWGGQRRLVQRQIFEKQAEEADLLLAEDKRVKVRVQDLKYISNCSKNMGKVQILQASPCSAQATLAMRKPQEHCHVTFLDFVV